MSSIADIPKFGGSLVFSSENISQCPKCNWRGMANTQGGRRVGHARYPMKTAASLTNGPASYKIQGSEYVTFCPVCERQPENKPPKHGRNEPCVCGSGKKFKKCCSP